MRPTGETLKRETKYRAGARRNLAQALPEMPRWSKTGKQKIEDAGMLYPERMKTVDNEIRDLANE